MSEAVTLTVNGQSYTGWTSVEVTRDLKACASGFSLDVTERWARGSSPQPWQIEPFNTCTITLGDDLVLTGYVEHYEPSYDGQQHSVRVSGRSKTCDLVDCMPDIPGGQFSGYKLDALARALCAPFGIDVVVQCDVGDTLPDATLEKTETAYAFLEKMARLRSVILTDNAQGQLLLTTAGKGGDAGPLSEGGDDGNIFSASAKLSSDKRFKTYVVLSQTPEDFNNGDEAVNDVEGEATDDGCPRNRRFAEMAENPADKKQADARAKWKALHSYAEGTEATITVIGFHQTPDGSGDLWDVNKTTSVHAPMLALDRSMLIGRVAWTLDGEGGRRTTMTVAPPEAFTPGPDPKGVTGNSAPIWTGKIT
ncbi:MAG TPA: hypothetical protein VGG10_15070 [Rhizomicrobium sp.]|jgi:prophage tail gpP-like protein